MPRPFIVNPSVLYSRKILLTSLNVYTGTLLAPTSNIIPIQANGGGNYILILRPDAFLDAQVQNSTTYLNYNSFTNTAFATFCNSTAISYQTGDMTPAGVSYAPSPLALSNENIVESTLISFSIKLNLIAPPLTTTGYVSIGTIHDQNYL